MRIARFSPVVLPLVSILLLSVAVALPGEGLASAGKAGKPAAETGNRVPDNGAILGEVNGEKLTVGQLREKMRATPFRHSRSFQGDDRARKMAYRDLIDERLIVRYMEARNPLSAEERGREEMVKTVAIGNRFLQNYRKRYVPTDNEVRGYFPKYMKTIDVRIFFGKSYSEAVDVREKVAAGEEFGKLVKERSVGPRPEEGGLLRNYRSPGILPEHVEEQAFGADAGWLSPVFENVLGYCFIRLEGVSGFSPEQIGKIAGSAQESARQAAAVRFVDEVKRSAVIEMDPAAIRRLESVPPKEWRARFGDVFAKVDGRPVTVEDLYAYILVARKGEFPRPPGSGEELSALGESLVKVLLFSERGKSDGIDKDPGFLEWSRKNREEMLIRKFHEEAAAGVTVEEKEAREHFKRNPDRWKRPEGREVRYVEADTFEIAASLAQSFREDPSRIDTFAVKQGDGENGGNRLIIYRGGVDPGTEEWIFGAKPGEPIGPRETRGRWIVLVVDRVIPARKAPRYEDNVSEVSADLRRVKTEKVIREKKEELYRKAAVLTRTELLEAVEW